jgi:hypothetical protein
MTWMKNTDVHFSARFYRAVGVCSMLSALTTIGLIFLPRLYPPVPDFTARMALGDEPAYVLRSWIYLVHPFLVFAAALGLAARCRARAAGAASLGLAGFALWAATEAGQQALTKVALDRTWRVAWKTADAATQAVIQQQVALYDVLWDAMYLLILIAFMAGNIILGLAVRRVAASGAVAPALGRAVAIALWAAAGLTLMFLLGELGANVTIPGSAWFYPLIQPAGRTLIGLWLWREATWEEEAARARPVALAGA